MHVKTSAREDLPAVPLNEKCAEEIVRKEVGAEKVGAEERTGAP